MSQSSKLRERRLLTSDQRLRDDEGDVHLTASKENIQFSFSMAQRPKPEVRARIVTSALAVFAERGFAGTTMAAIASHARVPIGNLYRYFPSKEDLLAAALPSEFPTILLRLLEEQIAALGTGRDVTTLPVEDAYWDATRRSLAFCLEHRHRVIFLLLRADETPYASFTTDLVTSLVRWALRYARRAYRGLPVTPLLRETLTQIYRDYVLALGHVLGGLQRTQAQLLEAIRLRTTYHLGGLRHLFEREAA